MDNVMEDITKLLNTNATLSPTSSARPQAPPQLSNNDIIWMIVGLAIGSLVTLVGVVSTAMVVAVLRSRGRRRKEREGECTQGQTVKRDCEGTNSTHNFSRGRTELSTIHATSTCTSNIELNCNEAYGRIGRHSDASDPYYSGYVIPDLLDTVAQSGLHTA